MVVGVGVEELLVGWDLVEGTVEEIVNIWDEGIVEMAYSRKDVLAISFACLVKAMTSRVLEDSMVGSKYYMMQSFLFLKSP